MAEKYRVVVEVLTLKTLDVEVTASNPETATKTVKLALEDYGTSPESLLTIQTDEADHGFRFHADLVSEEVNVKATMLAPSEDDLQIEPWFLKEMGLA
jgi:hypothetical protein